MCIHNYKFDMAPFITIGMHGLPAARVVLDIYVLIHCLRSNSGATQIFYKMSLTIDTITLPGLEMEVAVTGIRVSRDVAKITLGAHSERNYQSTYVVSK